MILAIFIFTITGVLVTGTPGGSASPATPSNNELLLPAVPSYLQGLVSQSCCHSQLAELTNKVD